MDLFDRLKSSDMGSLGRYSEEADGYYMFPKLEGELGPRMKFHGREIINWSINNYLGLANHPEIREADAKAISRVGIGISNGSPYDEREYREA
jgi:glycine C-acetyltransferase